MKPTASPETLESHEGTAAVMRLLTTLMEAGGWLTTSDLADRCEIGRDTARRQLRTLASQGWVRAEQVGTTEMWTIGPTLPRIGMQYQELLNSRARQLNDDLRALLTPFPRTRG